MNQSEKNQNAWLSVLVAAGMFICLYVFFTAVHPLYIYDTDDWTYIAATRSALPSIHYWNPTKVLPETLMPLAAEIGVRFIMPFTGDYIGSMTYVFAFVVTLCVVLYIFSFGRVIGSYFELNNKMILIMLVILLLLHFLPFNVNQSQNYHLFYSIDVNCYFNYLIPALFNAITVMYLMTHLQIGCGSKQTCLYNGCLILAVYLSINSNLLHSVVLMAYIGMRLIVSLAGRIHSGTDRTVIEFLKGYTQSYLFEIFVSMLWLVSVVMEAMGGRAQAWGNTSSFQLKEAVERFVISIKGMNHLFLFGTSTIIVLAFGMYVALKRKKKVSKADDIYSKWLYRNSICIILATIYLILLSARVSPDYIRRPDVMISWMFYFFLLVIGSLAYLINKIPIVCWLLPIVFYVLVFETVIDNRTYKNPYIPNYNADMIKALNENLVRQVLEAEAAGLDRVEVRVPFADNEGWPIAISYGGGRISNTLFEHGITNKHMNIQLVMDPSVNEEFHLP